MASQEGARRAPPQGAARSPVSFGPTHGLAVARPHVLDRTQASHHAARKSQWGTLSRSDGECFSTAVAMLTWSIFMPN
jgi:hypothetical protein